jgi:signal transduction protein with GAF and PtsI domain
MVEVPSLLFSSTNCAAVDFVSVGSNDLCSSCSPPTAATRVASVSIRSRPVLRALRLIARKGRRTQEAGDTLCGEMASKPRRAGADRPRLPALSLSPSAVGPVKAMLLELDAEKASGGEDHARSLRRHDERIRSPSATDSVRGTVRAQAPKPKACNSDHASGDEPNSTP